jgi:hypothetical protein
MARLKHTRDPVPPLAGQVQLTLDALAADGITPTPAQIAWLVALRKPCDAVNERGLPPMYGAPVELCGQLWYPLHALAEQWFRRAWVMAGDGDSDAPWRTWVYLFAHIYSAPGDRTLATLQSEETIRATVGEWRAGLPLHDETEPELVRFLRRLDGYDTDVPDPDAKESTERAPAGSLDGVSSLCKAFPGTTPDYWMTGISGRDIDDLMRTRQTAEDWAKSPERTEAIKRYLNAVKWIRYNHGK